MKNDKALEPLENSYSALGDCLVIPNTDTELKKHLISAIERQENRLIANFKNKGVFCNECVCGRKWVGDIENFCSNCGRKLEG